MIQISHKTMGKEMPKVNKNKTWEDQPKFYLETQYKEGVKDFASLEKFLSFQDSKSEICG